MSLIRHAAFALLVLLPSLAAAQAPPPAAAPKPDSPAVVALIDKAKKAGGPLWAEEARFFCESPRGNSPNDPAIAPTKIFDNVYIIGNTGTVVYVVRTSDGLVMFDALNANQVESDLLPAFKKLGLDPAQVRTVVVAHGHADHFGGSKYFQDRFKSKIYVSAADWNLMENPPPARGGRGGTPVEPPRRDQVITEGQPIVQGDFKIIPVAVPGHTPGSMGFIFPVRDNGRMIMAATYGGTILTPGPISDEGLQTYLKSVARFQDETRRNKVEVVMQNHPLMDPVQPKLQRLAARKPGEPNPFVVGPENYQRFLDVMAGCTEVNIARRK